MKKLLTVLLIFISIIAGYSQLQNINPDKTAEPWLVGGLRVPSTEELSKIPLVTISDNIYRSKIELPTSIDNSENKYFRPIISQSNGSCSQSSGIAYAFTYEMNRERDTDASLAHNQYPSHYTYNFLNSGSGAAGSIYLDGWDIIKANGCPTIETYGSLAITETHWMSGYSKYEEAMANSLRDYFAINIGTPEGLEILKNWFVNHLDENANIGGVVNFAAGVTKEFELNNDGEDVKITKWGYNVNHAMTFVGYDDNITYDYNNDGNITNDIDINNDNIVDMRDWEKGALIMVNSWGKTWAKQGKAYVMYKTLAEPVENGGIHANKVYGIHVKDVSSPQLTMHLKMSHNSRNKIQIIAGISKNLNDTKPEHTISFPLFNKQGGTFDMRGNGVADPIEIALDITKLLTYVDSGDDSKFFVGVIETDIENSSDGILYDYSVVNNVGEEFVCSNHDISLINNDTTLLSVVSTAIFEAPEITTVSLPPADIGVEYNHQLTASGGFEPYKWSLKQNYNESPLLSSFPNITSGKITPNNNDDGYVAVGLDFSFPFYDFSYDEIYISTDGSIVFVPEFKYLRSEEAIISNKMIAVYAHDLWIKNENHGIYYEGDANSATFRWTTTTWADTSSTIDIAVTIYPNGEISFYYGDKISNGLSWASGISNGKGSYEIAKISGANTPNNTQHKMTAEPFPIGITISKDGNLKSISPLIVGTWDLDIIVTDDNSISDLKTLEFNAFQAFSVDDIDKMNIKLYPNPTSKYLKISSDRIIDNISIYDYTGRLCINTQNHQNKIDISSLSSGVYFVKLKSKNGVLISRKIIVK